jgi:hypothetical protein
METPWANAKLTTLKTNILEEKWVSACQHESTVIKGIERMALPSLKGGLDNQFKGRKQEI